MLCTASNDRASFEELGDWITEILPEAPDESQLVPVLTKADLAQTTNQNQDNVTFKDVVNFKENYDKCPLLKPIETQTLNSYNARGEQIT